MKERHFRTLGQRVEILGTSDPGTKGVILMFHLDEVLEARHI